MELMTAPMPKPPGAHSAKVLSGISRPSRGVSRFCTMEVTMAVKAEPTTTPTAMSSTLPRMANSLNSWKNFFIRFSCQCLGRRISVPPM